jgi:peptidoglycan/LPS O-acetylase OafA/YrhL
VFGTLRLLLALAVVVAHLGWGPYLGRYAVFAFYVISGYLMCLVLDRRYGFGWAGLRGYAENRFLRIFPPYWAACGLSVALLAWFGDPGYGVLWYRWSMPDTAAEWIANLGILGLDPGPSSRLVSPAWALRVELFYYAALAAGLARGRTVAFVWAGVSVAWHVHLAWSGAGPDARYYPIAAASLPFSLGACVYHLREPLRARVRRPAAWIAAVSLAWLGLAVWVGLAGRGVAAAPFYASCGLAAALVALLSLPEDASPRLRRADARLGDLSYPIYLVHMQVGFLVASVSPLPHHGMALFVAALPAVFVFAWGMLRCVDDPVERLRGRVRARFDAAGRAAARVPAVEVARLGP